MNKEFEYRYFGYDKIKTIEKIKKLGFICKQNSTIIYNIVLKNKTNLYHRLRTLDGINFIYTQKKQNFNKDFDDEIEIKLEGDEETILSLLKNLGLNEKYRVEKMREIWLKDNIEIVFDIYPGAPEYCEIETNDEKTLENIEKELNFKKYRFKGGMKFLMKKCFNIDKKNNFKISFKSIPYIRELVSKNHKLFDDLFDDYL